MTTLPLLPLGVSELPPGTIASLVTYLEMTERPAPRPVHAQGDIALAPLRGDVARYAALYRRLGERWVWYSRLMLPQDQLAAIIAHPLVDAFALVVDGADRGLLEIDFRQPDEAELAFFGLTDEVIGGGYGRWMMEQALAVAWSRPIRRFWVHTCNFDHPAEIGFYRRSGFTPYKLAVEVEADPRATGVFPADAFPDLPPPRRG
jgi:GNAT superfamily N-acetyltransferase